MTLANWSPEENQPPYYSNLEDYTDTFEEPSIRIITNSEEEKEILQLEKYLKFEADDSEIMDTIRVNFEIWNLHLVQEVKFTSLLNDLDGRNYLEDMPEGQIKVYIHYPTQKLIEARFQHFTRTSDGDVYNMFTVGYIFWQLSKVYAEIFKHHWKEVGVWGHNLGDLMFEELKLSYDGVGVLSIAS